MSCILKAIIFGGCCGMIGYIFGAIMASGKTEDTDQFFTEEYWAKLDEE